VHVKGSTQNLNTVLPEGKEHFTSG